MRSSIIRSNESEDKAREGVGKIKQGVMDTATQQTACRVLHRAVCTQAPVAYLGNMYTNRCQADESSMCPATQIAGHPTAESAL